MSTTKWFVFMKFSLALVVWALGSGAAHAQKTEALSDGAALLQTLDKSNPAHNRLFQEVDKRLPQSAKGGNSESPLLMNPSDENRKFAAENNPDFIFIKKPDGTIGVAETRRVSKGLTSTVHHLTDHKDFPGLFRENYDRLKAEHDKALAKAKKKKGLAGFAASFAGRFAEFPARDAPASALRDYARGAWTAAQSTVMGRIKEASDELKAEEIARIDRGDPQPEPKPVDTAAEAEPEEESKTAEAEEPKDEPAEDQNADEVAAQRASATRKLDNLFNELDSRMAQFEAAANQDLAVCKRATDALKNGSEIDRLGDEAKRRLAPAKVTPGTEKIDTGPLVDQLKNMLETIGTTNRLSKDAGDSACKVVDGVTAASLGQDADKAGNLAVLADQLASTARSLAEPTMRRLAQRHVPSTPLKSLAEEFDDKRREAYKPLENYCKELESEIRPLQERVRKDGSLSGHWLKREDAAAMTKALARAKLGTKGIERIGQLTDADFRALDGPTKLVYEARLATYEARVLNLQQRANKCSLHQLQLSVAKCVGAFNLTESGFRDTEEYARAFEEQSKIRSDQLAHIRALLKEIERAAKQARAAADKARACVQQAEADGKIPDAQTVAEATGLADLSAVSCDVGEFDRRISELKSEKFKDVDGIEQHVASLEAKRGIIQAAHTKFEDGRTQFKQGDAAGAAAQLQAARAELAKLNGAPQCPDLAGRIDKGEQQSQQLGDLLSSAGGALNTCKVADIRAALRKIGGKTKPPKLLEMKTQLQQQMGVLALVGKARAAYKAGQYDQSLALLREAKAKKRALGSACPIIDQRIDNATAAVQRRRDQEGGAARVADAARSCNMTVLKSFVAGSGGITKALKARADDALQVCQAREEDRQARERADQLAARRAQCEKDHGAGYYPGEADSSGSYYCLPTQATANSWCNQNNPGSGWKAKRITSSGAFDCVQNRRQQVAAARADCRAQARAAGKVYAYTKMKKDGSYDCRWCDRGYRYRKGKCWPRRQRTRTVYTCPKGYYLRGRTCYSRNNGAAAAAAAAAAIGIINSLSRGGGGGGSTNCRVNPLGPNC